MARRMVSLRSQPSGPDMTAPRCGMSAELISQARSIAENHRELDAGEVQQFSVTTDRLTLMVSSVAKDYYLLLVLGPEGSYGRARFELKRARLLFEEDLS